MFEMHATRCDVFLGKVRTQLYFSFSERPKISPREPAPGAPLAHRLWPGPGLGPVIPPSALDSWSLSCLSCLSLVNHESLSGWVAMWRPSRLMFAFAITCPLYGLVSSMPPKYCHPLDSLLRDKKPHPESTASYLCGVFGTRGTKSKVVTSLPNQNSLNFLTRILLEFRPGRTASVLRVKTDQRPGATRMVLTAAVV